jgi:hypothetical protein
MAFSRSENKRVLSTEEWYQPDIELPADSATALITQRGTPRDIERDGHLPVEPKAAVTPATKAAPRADKAIVKPNGTIEGDKIWLCGKPRTVSETYLSLLSCIASKERTPVKEAMRAHGCERPALHVALTRIKCILADLGVRMTFQVGPKRRKRGENGFVFRTCQ